ncbi:MAG: DNA gyrase subunit A [Clostridiales bacterium]|jgi:DNA gyrase subunit A|nr:DNA gyrase subunit A [Clostridiales bacterium]
MENERIKLRDLETEMKESFIDYSMSVIVARALPDVRDGLKPVHRRILHSMNELNLDPTKAYKKSARITGDTMGKYHPHGNTAIYDAMVRLAQDFSLRYPLVDGHGNFGSMDGDGAAAERYTEARLSKLAMEMLDDIEKDTVDFIPNYDGELSEPVVLPAKFPNLLVNGASGIAVGMATNIPPHNLGEVVDGVVKIIDDRMEGSDTDIHELLKIIKGPDFPTGASILGVAGIRSAYLTGRGKVTVRANAEIVPMGNGRDMIVVSDIPYQVNKARMAERIADLIKDKKIEGISDMRDESNRDGVRIVIEIKKDVNANVVLNQLYKHTQMQETMGIIMLAIVNGEPVVLNLKDILTHYLEHQKDVILRRTRFELAKAEKRAHILEGYIIALDNIDEVIALIRSSKDRPQARERLSENFALTEEQATAIVSMQLGSLTGLEREKIEMELRELEELIKELNSILADERKLYSVIREEILIIKSKYADERRTLLVNDPGEINIEDLIDDETSVITMTSMNYIKRQPLTAYKLQKRGGKGIIGMGTREEDGVKDLFICNTHHNILFFTSLGRVLRIKAYEIPEAGRTAKGTNLVNLLSLMPEEKIAAVIPIANADTENEYLLMVTKRGIAKKTALSEYGNIRKSGLRAMTIREDDELITVIRHEEGRDIFIATHSGYGIRFNESTMRPLSRTAQGVKAIRLKEADYVIGAGALGDNMNILLVSEKGYGKRTDYEEFRIQNRAGMGTRVYKVTEKTGNLVGVVLTNEADELMIINSQGVIIRINVANISTIGRVTQGVKLINLNEGESVVSVARIAWDQLEGDEEDDAEVDADVAEAETDTAGIYAGDAEVETDGAETGANDTAIDADGSDA